jgi:hypothetical protein
VYPLVLLAVEDLGAGMELLGDEVRQPDDADLAWGLEAELADVERLDSIDVKDILDLHRGDLELDLAPAFALEVDDDVDAEGIRSTNPSWLVAGVREVVYALREWLVAGAEPVLESAAVDRVQILRRPRSHLQAKLHRDTALDQEERVALLVERAIERGGRRA